jgi:primosomal protein N' (replication factor Y)
VVTLDQFLRIADFRAGERAFALLWSAAERLDPTGRLVIQSQNPEHYAVRAVANQDHALFYGPELRFRAELGYPPFRRLCRVTVRARSEPDARALAEVTARRIEKAGPVTVYPALPDRRGLVWRIIVKGPAELSRLVAGALAEGDRRPRSRGIIEVEMDPVE